MKRLFLLLIVAVALTGCMPNPAVEKAQAEARIHEADSAAAIAQSQAEAHKFDTLANVAQGPNVALIVGIVMIGACVLVLLSIAATGAVMVTVEDARAARGETRQAPQITVHQHIQIPASVAGVAQRMGGQAEYDGARWLIVSKQGNVLARQKLLKG